MRNESDKISFFLTPLRSKRRRKVPNSMAVLAADADDRRLLLESSMELVGLGKDAPASVRVTDSPSPSVWRPAFGRTVQLTLWAQLGVLTRFWIDEGITSACYGGGVLGEDGGRGSCSTSAEDEVRSVVGIMVANMLGSFLMGFLTENKAHLVWFERPNMPVSFLPEDSWVQHHGDLLTGLRVGYCGCLTTFASWAAQMVRMLAEGKVGALVVVLLLETSSSLVSFVLGEHLAIRVHMAVSGVSHKHKRERERLWHQRAQNAVLAAMGREPEQGNQPAAISILRGNSGDEVWLVKGGSGAPEKYEARGPLVVTNSNLRPKPGGGGSGEDRGSDPPEEDEAPEVGPTKSQKRLILASNLVSALLLLALTSLWAVQLALDGSFTRRKCWLSVLIAPLGCFLRYLASMKLNNNNSGLLRGKLSWFPLGTFAINVSATVLSSASSALVRHYCLSSTLYPWFAIALRAFETGFNGSLSTVSTFAAEVSKYMVEYPRNFKGWIYVSTSFSVALFLGFCVYSWSAYIPQAC